MPVSIAAASTFQSVSLLTATAAGVDSIASSIRRSANAPPMLSA